MFCMYCCSGIGQKINLAYMIEGPLPDNVEPVRIITDSVEIGGKKYGGAIYFQRKDYISLSELADEYFPDENENFHPLFFQNRFITSDMDTYIKKDDYKKMQIEIVDTKDLYSMKDSGLNIRIFRIFEDSANVSRISAIYSDNTHVSDNESSVTDTVSSVPLPDAVSMTDLQQMLLPETKEFPCIYLLDGAFVADDPSTVKVSEAAIKDILVVDSEDFDSLKQLGPQFKILMFIPKYFDKDGNEIVRDVEFYLN